MSQGHWWDKPPLQTAPGPQDRAAGPANEPLDADYAKDRSPFSYDLFDRRAPQMRGGAILPPVIEALLAKAGEPGRTRPGG